MNSTELGGKRYSSTQRFYGEDQRNSCIFADSRKRKEHFIIGDLFTKIYTIGNGTYIIGIQLGKAFNANSSVPLRRICKQTLTSKNFLNNNIY